MMLRQPSVKALLWAALLVLASTLWPAHSARATVRCTASMTNLNFGSVNLVAGTGLSATATLSYTCTNDVTTATYARVCFNIGDGAQSLTYFTPRRMNNVLQFQIYHSSGATIWGSRANSTVPNPYTVDITIPAKSTAGNGTYSGTTAMQGVILTGQAAQSPGSYQNQFTGGHTAISWSSNTSTAPTNCAGTTQNNFPFTALATVVKACTVVAGSASNIVMGPVSSTATNVAGNNSIAVTCSGSTPYNIGLAPSNGSTTGAGEMGGTGSNTDKVPYHLRSTTGTGGTIWGNTATASLVGNGVAGSGSGVATSVPVYVTVPSANYQPDTYTDTVTVNVWC